MSEYRAPRRDQQFVLEMLAGLDNVLALPGHEELSVELVQAVIEEAGKFAADVLAPLNRRGDVEGCRFTPEGVTCPSGWREAFARFRDNGWTTLELPAEWGGQGMPKLVSTVVDEIWASANLAFSILPVVTKGAARALRQHASEAIRRTYLPKLVAGLWSGTMNLTEPHAGSDLSTLRTRAEPTVDGRYRLFGQKIFITYGDHDAAENIVHLVLARLPDAPPGVKGISLFVCSKYLVDADGSLGERNDVFPVSIEHKLGIQGSPTCVMAFGDHGGALAELVGEPGRGLEYMFVMMNEARFGVGVEGLALAERAYQQALAYAQGRVQGRDVVTGEAHVPIIRHPDVKRMLLRMRAQIMAMRGLVYFMAARFDIAERDPDADRAEASHRLIDLLMPVVKAWCSDAANEVASLGVQVHGGMGFVEETGAAQHLRDARILPIYEGTNGIQAIDLVGRKIERDQGRAVGELAACIRDTAAQLNADTGLAPLGERLARHVDLLERAVAWLLAEGQVTPGAALGSATPFLQLMSALCGAWQMGRLALAARSQRGDADDGYRSQLVVLANFYFLHVSVDVPARFEQVVAGIDSIAAAELVAD